MAERDLVEVMRIAMRLDPLDAPRKLASVLVRAVLMRRSFRNFGLYRFFRVNPRLAHLFMICSNIKLTGPAESIGIGGVIFMSNSNGIDGASKCARPPALHARCPENPRGKLSHGIVIATNRSFRPLCLWSVMRVVISFAIQVGFHYHFAPVFDATI